MPNQRELLEKVRANCDFFFEFDNNEMVTLLKLVKVEVRQKGELIFLRNDPASSFYIIIQGSVEIFVEHDHSKHGLARLRDGQIFGEMGLLYGNARTASAMALEMTQLFNISESAFVGMDNFLLLAKIYKSLARIVSKRAADLITKQRDEFIARL